MARISLMGGGVSLALALAGVVAGAATAGAETVGRVEIVLPEKANAIERFAAEELGYHLKKAPAADGRTGARKGVLGADRLRAYVDGFNAADAELYTNTVSNVAAADFLCDSVPRFECPDPDIERTYYFRWWTYRKHLKRTPSGWVVTEFLPPVSWAAAENTISCALGHHVNEGRWLRNGRWTDDYIRFMMTKGTVSGPRAYVCWPAWSAFERAKVSGDFSVGEGLLDAFAANFEAWERGWRNRGGFEAGFKADAGLFHQIGDREGTEFALSVEGARPMVNSAMWAEAAAIAHWAERKGDTALAGRFAAKAAALERSIKGKLWTGSFFTARGVDGTPDTVRELHGYAPFYFRMPLDSGYDVAWTPLFDPKGFSARCGLSFPTRDTPGFDVTANPARHPCLWSGPSWPYATSVALTALYERMQAGRPTTVPEDGFHRLLKQYAAQHVRRIDDGRTVPWIDENLHPDTGEWLARRILIEQARLKIRPLQYPERGRDYNHSAFCDLVIAGLCGIVPQESGEVVVRPLAPKEWDWWCLDGVRYHGKDITVLFDRDGRRYGKGKGLVVIKGLVENR